MTRKKLTSTPGATAEKATAPVSLQPLAYRPKDAATVLGVSKSTIYQMIADGDLEARKLGAATLIPHTELVRVLNEAPLTNAAKEVRR